MKNIKKVYLQKYKELYENIYKLYKNVANYDNIIVRNEKYYYLGNCDSYI